MWGTRQRLGAILGYLVAMFIGAIVMAFINSYSPQFYSSENLDNDKNMDIMKKLIFQRNAISETLNRQQQKIGALQCQMKVRVHERGGYCWKEAMAQIERHRNSRLLDNLIDSFIIYLKGKTAASFGEGAGVYTKRMSESGKLTKVAAYDGSPFCNETSGGRVQFLDLSVPQYGLPVYDWIISIEVAEHIPAQFEHIYLDNIARHAREGVIISWAAPGQAGMGHVNCRPFSYVKARLREIGFKHDEETSIKFKSKAPLMLKRNINLFIRKSPNHIIHTFS